MNAFRFDKNFIRNEHAYHFVIGVIIILFMSNNSSCKKEEPAITFSVGVFGASMCKGQTNDSKQIWIKTLKQDGINLQITSCGVNSMGFSSNFEKNVPWQIQNAKTFDIYIFWCGINDTHVCQIGEIGTTDLTTQSGGLLKSIELIKKRNESAIILLFTSLPYFSYDGYLETGLLSQFVKAQKQFCETYEIPYLDQFLLSGFNINNCKSYYHNDYVHLLNEGYCFVAPMQANFIRQILAEKLNEELP